jgi:UDP-glucose 4-epimerase
MTSKILLTGGLGYIGSHTYVDLVAAGYEVVILDNLSNSKHSVCARLEEITGVTTEFIHADILDLVALSGVFKNHKFDAVIHFAGLKAVGESVEKPLEYMQANITGLMNVLQVMQTANVKSIVFSSSATVYDAKQSSPLNEEMPTGYVNPYGFTKLTCEQILEQARFADPELKTGVLRYFNPAGAHQSGLIGEDPNDIPNNLMPYISRVASGDYPHLRVWGNDYDTPDGTGVRDYIHVSDLAEGHVKSVQALLARDASHLVNLGRGQGYSVMDMLKGYSVACGRELPYEIMPRRAGDLATTFAEVGRAKQLLGFSAVRDLNDMCNSSWNWIQTGAKHVSPDE